VVKISRLKKSAEIQERYRFIINGIIQGVGFRPFLYRTAISCGLKGYALNASNGVVVEVQGSDGQIEQFEKQLQDESPPLAEITSIDKLEIEPLAEDDSFEILPSEVSDITGTILIPPDISTCKNCFAEMTDPSDRRYFYPFTNCTDCGPRYTIIESLPYDRSATAMSKFRLCPRCREEYGDPDNRRFHAEPNACPVCGPSLILYETHKADYIGKKNDNLGTIKKIVSLIESGHVVAVKGLGGFHITCDADNPDAVRRLRQGKNRPTRPLAVMSQDIETVRSFSFVNDHEEALLSGARRPITLLKKHEGTPLAEGIADNNGDYGVMLPYTPLHFLLLKGNYRALVMTSANNSNEPIIKDNTEAIEKLSDSVDYILLHNRDILVRCDDSIVRWDGEKRSFIRLSRGWAPYPLKMKSPEPDRLACGAELKNSFCLVKGDYAYISGHIGDLEQKDTFDAYIGNINHLLRLLKIEPELVLHDLHPDYLSTRFAKGYTAGEKIAVQHHHAHTLSCMADNGIDDDVISIALDGTGYGSDGTIWGGEILIANRGEFERYAHFLPLPLPGGDSAAKEPWRMALSYILNSYPENYDDVFKEIVMRRPDSQLVDSSNTELIIQMIQKRINSPLTSAAGRLFGAVSALLGIKEIATFEGEAEMALEWVSSGSEDKSHYDINISGDRGNIIPTDVLFSHVVQDYLNDHPVENIGRRFHNTLVEIISREVYGAYMEYKIKKIVLTGGVFQNMILLNGLRKNLKGRGLEPITHGLIPANDAGISTGQAYFIRKG
jgi:hydrogenase maturation protein HypF